MLGRDMTKADLMLYAVTDRSWLKGSTLYSQVEEALKGGATFIQLREKNLNKSEFLKEAQRIRVCCDIYQVPFVINDDVEIAIKSNADGVHLGQKDRPVQEVRAILGEDKIIGVSARTIEQAKAAERDRANYIGVGAVFETKSKLDTEHVNYEMLKAICDAVSIPVIAIGGISQDNIHRLAGSGIAGVAVISAIFAQENIKLATHQLKVLTQDMLHTSSEGGSER